MEPKAMENKGDRFSWSFFYLVPWLVPIFVVLATWACVPFFPTSLLWLPLLLLYWAALWVLILLYQKKRGHVFSGERFRFTLRLQGERLWLQYLLVYGPLLWSVPLFLFRCAPRLSLVMILVILLAAVINGPSEEIYWRACLEEAGQRAGLSPRRRLLLAPIFFSLWHTAFVVHLFPWDRTWFASWIVVLAITWLSGLSWHWVLHRSGRLLPQCVAHSCANFFNVFPLMLLEVLHFSF